MFVDHRRRLVFSHNPKTGGRSVIDFVGFDDTAAFRLAHMPTHVIHRKIFQDSWSDFFSFCVVRNPWERYVSLYYFQRSQAYREILKNNRSAQIAAHFQLNEWIEYNFSSEDRSNWFGIDQIIWWQGVAKVYRFERLSELFDDLSSRYGISKSPRKRNVNNEFKTINRARLTDRSINIIGELDKATIQEFGYAPG